MEGKFTKMVGGGNTPVDFAKCAEACFAGAASLVRPLQGSLKLLGFYEGAVDGRDSPEFRKAVGAFEKAPWRALGKDAQPLAATPQLTGRTYIGREAPSEYLKDTELAKFKMPVESLRPYANEEGWVGVMWGQDGGVTERGASRAVGGIAFYNVNTGEYYHPKGDTSRHAFSMMSGGAPDVGKRPHEWNRDGAAPGLWETDHDPDPNINLVSKVYSHDGGHRWGFFTHISHPYVGSESGNGAPNKKQRDNDIGIHPDVGAMGSHGCPNVQQKDQKAFKAAMKETKVTHFVTVSHEVVEGRAPAVEPPKPARRSDLPASVRAQADRVADASVRGGEDAEAEAVSVQPATSARVRQASVRQPS